MKLAPPHHYPSAWYPLCCASELSARPLKVRLFGVDWVLFRGQGGRPAAVYAYCSHLGADLSRGDVVGGRLRCHFHHWEYGADGRCEHIPACASSSPPQKARQVALTCEERHGLIFGFLGGAPSFELPAPDFEPGHHSAPSRLDASVPYQIVGANIFDLQHLLAVHQRRLIGDATLSETDPAMIRILYRAEVLGEHLYDRALIALGMREVTIEIESWGGSIFLCFFRTLGHVTLMASQPVDETHTRLYLVTLRDVERDRGRGLRGLLGRAAVEVHHRMNVQFIAPDVRSVEGCRLDIQTLLPGVDHVLSRWIKHYRSLPTEDVSDLVTG